MQPLARELNFTETMFVYPPRPATATPACGSSRRRSSSRSPAIRCSARRSWWAGRSDRRDAARDRRRHRPGRARAGRLADRLRADDAACPERRPYEHQAELLAALGVERSGLPVEVYDLGPTHVYVELPDEEAVTRLEPDLTRLARFEVGANCFAGSGTRWKNRMFAPGHGVAEDPATGSAAGPLRSTSRCHGRIAFGEEIDISQGAEIAAALEPSTRASRAPPRDRARRGRRLGRDRGARRVPALAPVARRDRARSCSGSSPRARARSGLPSPDR